jgi:hypothetical protein
LPKRGIAETLGTILETRGITRGEQIIITIQDLDQELWATLLPQMIGAEVVGTKVDLISVEVDRIMFEQLDLK